jgi:hypothetical protein
VHKPVGTAAPESARDDWDVELDDFGVPCEKAGRMNDDAFGAAGSVDLKPIRVHGHVGPSCGENAGLEQWRVYETVCSYMSGKMPDTGKLPAAQFDLKVSNQVSARGSFANPASTLKIRHSSAKMRQTSDRGERNIKTPLWTVPSSLNALCRREQLAQAAAISATGSLLKIKTHTSVGTSYAVSCSFVIGVEREQRTNNALCCLYYFCVLYGNNRLEHFTSIETPKLNETKNTPTKGEKLVLVRSFVCCSGGMASTLGIAKQFLLHKINDTKLELAEQWAVRTNLVLVEYLVAYSWTGVQRISDVGGRFDKIDRIGVVCSARWDHRDRVANA